MSNVRTDLLSDRTGLKPPGVTKADFVKTWVNANQTGTQAVAGSLNVSSILDTGVGLTTVNFTNAMAAATYGFTTGFAYVGQVTPSLATSTMQAGLISLEMLASTSGTHFDTSIACASINGVLA